MITLKCAAVVTLALTAAAVAAEPPNLTIETVAGNGQPGDIAADPANALRMAVDQPFGVECGPDGALYITSVGQHRVLRLDLKSRELSSVAGTGKSGHAGDGGPATAAQLNEPYEVRFDAAGHYMYFVEMKNHLVRRVDLHTGTITSIAGNGQKQLPPDGAKAAGQPIFGPRALHIVGRTMWIALREGNSIWRLDLDTGVIRRVAGTGKSGYSGDGGPPLEATFAGPKGIAATSDGLVYVVDTENQVVRLIDTKANRISTIGGSGPAARGYGGDKGPALKAKVDRPHGIGLGPDGTLYLGDTNNHRVRALHP